MFKKIAYIILGLMLCSVAVAGTVSITELTEDQSDVNATEINQLVTPLLNEFNGSIENVNIASNAGIAWTKLNTTGQVVNADVSATAAIAGTKVAPDFGAQAVTTTGQATLGYLTVSNNLSVTNSIDCQSVKVNLSNSGASVADTLYSTNIIKAWARFTGTGTATLLDSFNVTSITDNGTGDYTVTWATDFANTNYCVIASADTSGPVRLVTLATGSVRFTTVDSGANPTDAAIVCVMAMGDQ